MQQEKLKKGKPIRANKASPDKKAQTGNVSLVLILVSALFIGVCFWYDPSLRDPYLSVRFLWLSVLLLGIIGWFLWFKKPILHITHSYTAAFFSANLLFILWNIICVSQAINIQESIYVIARQGLFFLNVVLFLALFNQSNITVHALAKALTLILIVQSIVGILQAFDLAFTTIPGDPHPTGFSGNRNLYASLLPLLLPFAFYTLFVGNRNWRIIAATTVGLGMLALLLGQTRSAWLSFFMSVLVFQVLFWMYRRRMSPSMVRNWGVLSLASVVGIVLAIGIVFVMDTDGALRERLKNRILSFYDFSELDAQNEAARTVNERLLVWKSTFQMIQHKPILGVAPGNWRLEFPEYGGISALKGDEPEELDKVRVQPHNVYLQVASESGIPGLILLLLIGSLVIAVAFTNISHLQDPNKLLLHFLLLAGMTSFAADMVFSFPQERVEHSVLLALMVALLFNTLEKNTVNQKQIVKFSTPITALLLVPILIFCVILGNKKRTFDHYTLEAIKYETRNSPLQALAASEKGKSTWVTLDPVSDPMELHSARAYLKLQQFDKALLEINTAERYHPNSHRIFNTKAVIFLNQNQYQEAIEPLQKALKYSPNYIPSLRNLAYSYYRTDQYQKSLEVLERLDIQSDTVLQQIEKDLKRRLENEKRDANLDH